MAGEVQKPKNDKKEDESLFSIFDKDGNSAEEVLNFISLAILIIGVLAGLYIVSEAELSADPTGRYVTAGILIIGSVIQWAFAKVFVNISKTLKEINSKLK